MEHRSLDEIREVAQITPLASLPRAMTRREKLERWAELLEGWNGRSLRPLTRVEYLSPEVRRYLRGESTPLKIAYDDAVLRQAGLAGDTMGDAMGFFALSDWEAHHLLCDCHYLGSMTPALVATRVRAIARKAGLRDLWERARRALMAH
jgi:hypothetical protein